jgi:DsbC/DsbD-like thiol-disulfide interchange protein
MVLVSVSLAQNPEAKSEPVSVQAVLKGRQMGADGKETLSIEIIMQIENGWHVYANPAGDEIFVPTVVAVPGVSKDDVEIAYPRGKAHRDDTINVVAYHYEGKTAIPVTVRRALVHGKPDPRPVEVTVRYQACSDARCLAPKTVKLTVATTK